MCGNVGQETDKQQETDRHGYEQRPCHERSSKTSGRGVRRPACLPRLRNNFQGLKRDNII